MFWGLVLEPEKSYAQVVETPFHVSMAALDLKNADAQEEASTLILRQDDVEYVLGNLSRKHKLFNLPLGLDFDMGEEIEFAVQGSSQIHLTGFLADTDDGELDEEDEGSVFEEKIRDIKKAHAAKRKLTEGDKTEGSSKKQRILDESFNDETDEDDFDITENDLEDEEESDDEDDDDDGEEEEEEESDEDDDEEEEEVESPKKQVLQVLDAKLKKQKQHQQQQHQQQQHSNKQGGQHKQGGQQNQQNKQGQNKQGQQNQQNKQGQQQNKQGQQQKTPQKGTPQSNKSPQKSPQPNKQKTPQPGNKTPQQGKQGKTPQQVNGSAAQAKPQKKVVKGVVIEDVAEGSGKVASAHKKVGVYYVGRLARNKKEFDKSQGGEPFKFMLGRGEVIPGWDIGVDGMRVGGKRRLTIPANLAYGNKGAPPAIPPNSNLEFEVTLVSVK